MEPASVSADEIGRWAREVLEATFPERRLRAYVDADDPRPERARLTAELAGAGMLAAALPTEAGGSGLGVAEVAAIVAEAGRALLPVDLAASAVLAAAAPGDTETLRRAASGELVAVLAWPVALAAPSARPGDGSAVRIDGRVLAAGFDGATHLLLVAEAAHGPLLVLVERDQPSVETTDTISLDRTRPIAAVALSDAEATVLSDDRGTVARASDLAALLTAADSLGAMRGAHAIALEHAKQRRQFGAPIGSFQQVAALLADGHVAIVLAEVLVADAAEAFDDPAGEVALPVAMAKSYACEHARRVTADAIQVLGGSGFTWETLIHLHFRRATVNLDAHGGPAWHRGRIV
jgi:alkylation response protein AidB-like acyl-CoA dehydrogenase